MNNIKSIVFVLFLGLVAASCGENSNSGKTGSLRTESGYDFEVHEKGSGAKVNEEDFVYFTLVVQDDKGTVLQDMTNQAELPSMQLPPVNDPARLNNPVFDVFAQASEGDSLSLFMPIDSLKGGTQGLDGVQMITYNLKVVEVRSPEENDLYNQEKQAEEMEAIEAMKLRLPQVEATLASTLAAYKNNTLQGVIEAAEGLKYVIHEEGTGPLVAAGDNIDAQYYGVLESDGEMFDNSFRRGKAFNFTVGQGRVIRGWDEGFQLLKEGTKATLIIPSDLGYGAAGSPGGIPPAANLLFYVEVEKIN